MIKLYDKERNTLLGEITEEQLSVLVGSLVEESSEDTDYYLNRDTIDLLREQGADDALVAVLTKALNDQGEGEIRWSDE